MEAIEIGIVLLQTLLILVLTLFPYLLLVLLSALGLQDTPWKIFKTFLLLVLPWLIILIGVFVGVDKFGFSVLGLSQMWYYLIPITWFGSGLIFYQAFD